MALIRSGQSQTGTHLVLIALLLYSNVRRRRNLLKHADMKRKKNGYKTFYKKPVLLSWFKKIVSGYHNTNLLEERAERLLLYFPIYWPIVNAAVTAYICSQKLIMENALKAASLIVPEACKCSVTEKFSFKLCFVK